MTEDVEILLLDNNDCEELLLADGVRLQYVASQEVTYRVLCCIESDCVAFCTMGALSPQFRIRRLT